MVKVLARAETSGLHSMVCNELDGVVAVDEAAGVMDKRQSIKTYTNFIKSLAHERLL